MNTNLSLFANLGGQIQEFLSLYLLSISLCILLGAALLLFFMGRAKTNETTEFLSGDEFSAGLTPVLDTRIAILVVDDSAVARAKLSKLFEAAGYRVELAKDGLEAIEKLSHDFFFVLLTDLEMPRS